MALGIVRDDRAEAELERIRSQRDQDLTERVRRLEIAAGIASPDASDDTTEN